jgi:hypothetical protein
MNVNEIAQFIEKIKASGVQFYEGYGMKIQFSQAGPVTFSSVPFISAPIPGTQSNQTQQDLDKLFKQESSLDQMTEEEILFAATPYGQELQAKREEQESKLAAEGKENKSK